MQLSDQLVQAIANYLGTKPYQEVARLIGAIQAEVKQQGIINEPEKTDDTTKPERPEV